MRGFATLTLLVFSSCARSETPAPAATVAPAAPAAETSAPTALASHESTPPLPANHPPVGAATQPSPAVAPPPPQSGIGASGLTWTPPASWLSETPSSPMRKAQFKVPGKGGDAECVVFYFGPGQGGDAASNVQRWAGQFTAPDGKPATATTRKSTAGSVEILHVEVTGTYGGGQMMGSAPVPPTPDAMLLGAIAQGPDANWFFKLTGPRETVEGARKDFEGMLASLGAAPGTGR